MKTINISLASEGYTHKNWFYKNIFINFSMIYYIIDGTAYYSDENGTILLKKNHLYIFPARKMFTLYDDSQNQLYHTFIHAITLPSVNSLVEVNVQDDCFLRDTIALLRKYLNSFNKQFVSNILDLILAYVFADIPINTHPKNIIAIEAKRYIDEKIENKINLDDLSKQFSYSKTQLNRLFKKYYNKAPIEYYNDKRLELSIKYLLEGKSSADISAMLNYTSPAAFCNAFKLKYGLSPNRYVEILQKEPNSP